MLHILWLILKFILIILGILLGLLLLAVLLVLFCPVRYKASAVKAEKTAGEEGCNKEIREKSGEIRRRKGICIRHRRKQGRRA